MQEKKIGCFIMKFVVIYYKQQRQQRQQRQQQRWLEL